MKKTIVVSGEYVEMFENESDLEVRMTPEYNDEYGGYLYGAYSEKLVILGELFNFVNDHLCNLSCDNNYTEVLLMFIQQNKWLKKLFKNSMQALCLLDYCYRAFYINKINLEEPDYLVAKNLYEKLTKNFTEVEFVIAHECEEQLKKHFGNDWYGKDEFFDCKWW